LFIIHCSLVIVLYFFDFFDFAVKFPYNDAQGIEAVSFFAEGKKDTSGKPGPRAVLPCGQVGARMRPDVTKPSFLFIIQI
jgi:hypothetical protein